MRKHRLVAYARGIEEESGLSYTVPWSKVMDITVIVGSLAGGGDIWISKTKIHAVFKILGVEADPTPYQWCLQLQEAD